MDLCDGLLECPHNMAAGFSRANNPRESKVEAFFFVFLVFIYLAALVLVAARGIFHSGTQAQELWHLGSVVAP